MANSDQFDAQFDTQFQTIWIPIWRPIIFGNRPIWRPIVRQIVGPKSYKSTPNLTPKLFMKGFFSFLNWAQARINLGVTFGRTFRRTEKRREVKIWNENWPEFQWRFTSRVWAHLAMSGGEAASGFQNACHSCWRICPRSNVFHCSGQPRTLAEGERAHGGWERVVGERLLWWIIPAKTNM